ncbi:MAG: signal peptidase I [Trebonia sp.]
MASEPGRPGSDGAPDQDPPGAPDAQGNQNGQDPAPADAHAGEQAPAGEKKQRRKRPFWRDLVVIVVAALALTILLKAFVVEVFSIPSGSMENTLVPGDRVLVSKIVYRFRDIARGDVVVFSGQGSWGPDTPPPPGNPFLRLWGDLTNLIGVTEPGTDYIKRVIGLPGDRVVCCDAQGRITVNGVPLNEQSYIHPGDVPSSMPFDVVVPAGRLWVMGDNRADSDDSRYRTTDPGGGAIPESEVVGRAFAIIWPPSRIGDLPIPATFQQVALHATAAAPAVLGGTAAALTVGVLVWRRRRAPELGDDSREMGS